MQLLLRHLICLVCFLCLSCVSISSDVKHSEWMRLKEERKGKQLDLFADEVRVDCEYVKSEQNIKSIKSFDIYCNYIKQSIQLVKNHFLENHINNLTVKVEVLPFKNPSRFRTTPYSFFIFPVIDDDATIVVSWFGAKDSIVEKKLIHSKKLEFDRFFFFWSFLVFGQVDLIKRSYEGRWYDGERFDFNLTGIYYPGELALPVNRRMIQDVLDGKVSLIRPSN